MDIPRPDEARKRRLRRIIYSALGLIAVTGFTVMLSRLEPAAPTVDRATVYMDTVKRGSMLRQVRGPGKLVPENIRWVPAATEGRVERILVLPGTAVKANTVLIELSNPQLVQEVLDAKWQVEAAVADYENLKVQLESQILDQRAAAATVESEFRQAQLQAEVDAELVRDGLASGLTYKQSKLKAEELATRHEIEKERVAVSAKAAKAQLLAQRARVESLRAFLRLKREQVASLKIRAGIDGVLQQVPREMGQPAVGQQVTAGTALARVAQPNRLKAELKIAETQAKDLLLGQPASIDTRNGVVSGHVIRIDPAVLEGTVTVDVALDGPLPKGARPDLSVEGTIELERLVDILYVGRPAFGQAESVVGLFKLVNGRGDAVRVQVKLGRSSVNTIEILQGLEEGDEVILSDMSRWDAVDQIRLD